MRRRAKGFVSWEAHLVRRAKLGERVAFELLADLYRPILFRLAVRMLRHAEDANDAVQETFVKALRGLGDFDENRPIKPWLCRICANCCVDAVRNRRYGSQTLDGTEDFPGDSSDTVLDRANRNLRAIALEEAISRLPDKYRRIIHMRHVRHMDVNEIAAELKKPEGTIKSWLFRARALLRKDLGPAFG